MNDVLIKVKKTAICGTDIHIFNWDDWAQKTIPVPMTVGHEFSGKIVYEDARSEGRVLGDMTLQSHQKLKYDKFGWVLATSLFKIKINPSLSLLPSATPFSRNAIFFGTKNNSVKSVKEIVDYMIFFWGSGKIKVNRENKFYEQKNLQLDINKAKKRLKWIPTYSVKRGVQITTEWYLQVYKDKKDPFEVTNKQITDYMNENIWH